MVRAYIIREPIDWTMRKTISRKASTSKECINGQELKIEAERKKRRAFVPSCFVRTHAKSEMAAGDGQTNVRRPDYYLLRLTVE